MKLYHRHLLHPGSSNLRNLSLQVHKSRFTVWDVRHTSMGVWASWSLLIPTWTAMSSCSMPTNHAQ